MYMKLNKMIQDIGVLNNDELNIQDSVLFYGDSPL